MRPFSLLPSPKRKKGGEGGSLSSDVGLGFFAVTLHWAVWLRKGKKKKLLHTELHISGSGSANVGDRGIWGLKPLYLPSYKSCFIAYTSALANMICIVTSLPAGELYLIYVDAVTGPVREALLLLCSSATDMERERESAEITAIRERVDIKELLVSGQLIRVGCGCVSCCRTYRAHVTRIQA